MNKELVAKELLSIARELAAMEFPSNRALETYLSKHPDADKSKHTVRDKNKDGPKKGWFKVNWI